jgi:hypothetical protein
VIDYEQAQARVNAKYDSWQRDFESVWGKVGECNEGDACVYFES